MNGWKKLGLAVAAVAGITAVAVACDTPVYRYAMYNWSPSPYQVFFFHEGEIAKEDQEVNKQIASLSSAVPASANILVATIDVGDEAQLERLPKSVIKAWESTGKKQTPVHVVFTSWRMEVGVERLTKESVESLVDSPARTQIAELLDQGHAAVFVLIACADSKQNEEAEKVVRGLIADVESGKALGEEPPSADETADGAKSEEKTEAKKDDAASLETEPASPSPPKPKLTLLKLARDDPAEKWLLRSFLTVEQEVPEAKDQPLVFAVYARGRALPPCIGKGITAENLLQDVFLLTGPCSCMIKEQNPGVDLLFRWDWDSTAQRWANSDPQSPNGGEEEEEEEESSAMEAAVTDEPEAKPAEKGAATEKPSQPAAEPPSAVEKTADPPEPTANAGVKEEATPAEASVAPATQPAAVVVEPQQPRSTRWVWRFGIGLVVAAIIILAAGHALTRKQSE